MLTIFSEELSVDSKSTSLNCRINNLVSDLDSVYHQASQKFGLSDSESYMLYLLYERGGKCPLSEIVKITGISKQTINSALRKMEKEELVYTETVGKRAKIVCRTEKGKELSERTVAKIFEAECAVFDDWTEEEAAAYVGFMERYNRDFKKKIEKL